MWFIAQALQVAFVHRHDAYYPVFIPLTSAEDGAAPVSDKFEPTR